MQERDVLISVIVPVYNVEPFLDRCVETLLAQTYRNLEIILVDDGSPDACPDKCDKWADLDARIKVIHQKNGGLSAARNSGLREVHGDYVLFVDSDDWLELHMIETMQNTAVEQQADIVNCQFVREKSRESSTHLPPLYAPFVKNGREGTVLLCEDKTVTSHVWRNLFRRELLTPDLFPAGFVFEDLHVMHEIFFKSTKIVFIGDVLYHYFVNETGIVKTQSEKNKSDYFRAMAKREDFIRENLPEIFQRFRRKHARMIYSNWRKACQEYTRSPSSDLSAIIRMTEKMLVDIPLHEIVFKKRFRVALLKMKYRLFRQRG